MTYFWIIILILLIIEFIQLKNIYDYIETISNLSDTALEHIKQESLEKYFKYLNISRLFKDKLFKQILLFIIIFLNLIIISLLYGLTKFILTIL